MRERSRRWMRTLMGLAMGSCLLQAECIRDVQRELELILRPDASLQFARDSVLVDLFGPGLLSALNF